MRITKTLANEIAVKYVNDITSEKLQKLKTDLDEEILRVKTMINEKGYSNTGAFNFIVREYRNKLKGLRSIITEDINYA